jgi:hypothetical protein
LNGIGCAFRFSFGGTSSCSSDLNRGILPLFNSPSHLGSYTGLSLSLGAHNVRTYNGTEGWPQKTQARGADFLDRMNRIYKISDILFILFILS